MKPSSSGDSSPSPPSHKLELQTLKLEELTVSLELQCPRAGPRPANPRPPTATALGQSVWVPAPACWLPSPRPQILAQHLLPRPRPSGLRAPAAAAPAGTPSLRDQGDAPGAHARWRPAQRPAETPARGQRGRCSLAAPQAQDAGTSPAVGHGEGGAVHARTNQGKRRRNRARPWERIANEMLARRCDLRVLREAAKAGGRGQPLIARWSQNR